MSTLDTFVDEMWTILESDYRNFSSLFREITAPVAPYIAVDGRELIEEVDEEGVARESWALSEHVLIQKKLKQGTFTYSDLYNGWILSQKYRYQNKFFLLLDSKDTLQFKLEEVFEFYSGNEGSILQRLISETFRNSSNPINKIRFIDYLWHSSRCFVEDISKIAAGMSQIIIHRQSDMIMLFNYLSTASEIFDSQPELFPEYRDVIVDLWRKKYYLDDEHNATFLSANRCVRLGQYIASLGKKDIDLAQSYIDMLRKFSDGGQIALLSGEANDLLSDTAYCFPKVFTEEKTLLLDLMNKMPYGYLRKFIDNVHILSSNDSDAVLKTLQIANTILPLSHVAVREFMEKSFAVIGSTPTAVNNPVDVRTLSLEDIDLINHNVEGKAYTSIVVPLRKYYPQLSSHLQFNPKHLFHTILRFFDSKTALQGKEELRAYIGDVVDDIDKSKIDYTPFRDISSPVIQIIRSWTDPGHEDTATIRLYLQYMLNAFKEICRPRSNQAYLRLESFEALLHSGADITDWFIIGNNQHSIDDIIAATDDCLCLGGTFYEQGLNFIRNPHAGFLNLGANGGSGMRMPFIEIDTEEGSLVYVAGFSGVLHHTLPINENAVESICIDFFRANRFFITKANPERYDGVLLDLSPMSGGWVERGGYGHIFAKAIADEMIGCGLLQEGDYTYQQYEHGKGKPYVFELTPDARARLVREVKFRRSPDLKGNFFFDGVFETREKAINASPPKHPIDAVNTVPYLPYDKGWVVGVYVPIGLMTK